MAKSKKNIVTEEEKIKNIFLNTIITILSLLIVYLFFSMFMKVKEPGNLQEDVQKPSPVIQVEVLNGCGAAGVGERFTDYLRDNDVDVVTISNYIRDGKPYYDITNTLVIDRIGNFANAEKIGEILGVKKGNILQQKNKDYLIDVTVIIGKDFKLLNPMK